MSPRVFVLGLGLSSVGLGASACTSIIGDGYVIEDDDNGPSGTGTGTGGDCSTSTTGSDCELCLQCNCSALIESCNATLACSDCLVEESQGFCDFADPTLNALLACFEGVCGTPCAA